MKKEIIKAKRFIIIYFLLIIYFALPGHALTLKQLFDYQTISDVKVSPDGTRTMFTVTTADLDHNNINSDIWLIDLKTKKYFQLTHGEKIDRAPAWSPNGKKIAFLSNRKDSNQIWIISPTGGEAELAAYFGPMNIIKFKWLPHGEGFIFLAIRPQMWHEPSTRELLLRERNQRRPIIVNKNITHYNLKPRLKARLWKVILGEKKPVLLIKEDFHILSFDISPDAKSVVFSSQPASGRLFEKESDLKILDLESNQVRDLVKLSGSDLNPQFSPDGKKVAFIHNKGGLSNRSLKIVNIDGTGLKAAAPAYDENIMNFNWSFDNKHIFFLGNRGVSVGVFSTDVSTGKYEKVEAFNGLHVCKSFSFSPDGLIGAAAISDASSPEEVYVTQNGGKSKSKLTQINNRFCGKAPMTEILKYKSKDGLDIEALVVKPKDFKQGKRYPLLVIVHGGPDGVFTYSFNPRIIGVYPLHAFAEQGYIVFLPNPRGSTGYGESFRIANFQDLGGKDFEDIMAGVDLLIKKGIADSDRMGLMGWSYGGFMAYWAVTHTNRFKAISAGAGLTDLISFYGTNDAEGAGIETYMGSPPWENPQLFLDHSPLLFIKKAKTPLLIQHGGKDIRVPLAQAQEFYFAAVKIGLPIEMVVYPEQGHIIRDPQLSLAAMKKNLDWFNKWLLGK